MAFSANALESYGIAALCNFGMFELGASYIGEDDMDILGYELSSLYHVTANGSDSVVYNQAKLESDVRIDYELQAGICYDFQHVWLRTKNRPLY